MDIREEISNHTARVMLGLGEGKKLRDVVGDVVMWVNQEAYERGKQAGIKEERDRQKEASSK